MRHCGSLYLHMSNNLHGNMPQKRMWQQLGCSSTKLKFLLKCRGALTWRSCSPDGCRDSDDGVPWPSTGAGQGAPLISA